MVKTRDKCIVQVVALVPVNGKFLSVHPTVNG